MYHHVTPRSNMKSVACFAVVALATSLLTFAFVVRDIFHEGSSHEHVASDLASTSHWFLAKSPDHVKAIAEAKERAQAKLAKSPDHVKAIAEAKERAQAKLAKSLDHVKAIAEAKERAQAKENTKNSSTAERESDGFMAYDEEEWQRLKDIHRAQSQRQRGGDHPQGSVFYQQNYEPTWSCPFERRVGNIGDGGKWVCDPHRLPDDCLVLSVGSASEWSFEEGIHALKPHCEIHTFDHTIQPHNVPSFVHFHAIGLDKSSLLDSINATGRTVDILKIDCEGCEWDTFDQFEGRQVLVELHGVGRAHQLFEAMARKGYVIFHKEPNIQYGGGECVEYGFLRLNLPP